MPRMSACGQLTTPPQKRHQCAFTSPLEVPCRGKLLGTHEPAASRVLVYGSWMLEKLGRLGHGVSYDTLYLELRQMEDDGS
jgi:hypothetical protein